MVHKNTKTMAIIGILVLLASLVLSVSFFTVIRGHRDALQNEKNALATEKAHQEALNALLHTVESSEHERTELASRVVHDDAVINFLSLFETVGKEQGVLLKTDSLATTPLNDLFETLEVHVSIKGPYASIMRVLTLFEHLPYQSSVTSVNITHANQGNGTEPWSGSFVLLVTKFKKV